MIVVPATYADDMRWLVVLYDMELAAFMQRRRFVAYAEACRAAYDALQRAALEGAEAARALHAEAQRVERNRVRAERRAERRMQRRPPGVLGSVRSGDCSYSTLDGASPPWCESWYGWHPSDLPLEQFTPVTWGPA